MKNIIEINDFSAPELDIYARTSEVQLLRYNEPAPGFFIAESPKVIERACNAGYEPVSFLVEHKDLEGEAKELLERFPEIPVYTAEYEITCQNDRLCAGTGNALCHETPHASVYRRNLSEYQTHCNSGKCRESDQHRCDFPQCGGTSYGCGPSDQRMQ